jgi:GMP synthase-like glutamine amidotransferase
MHIGILVTNTDSSEFAKRRPSDGEKFKTLLQPLRPDWDITALQVKDGEFPKSVHDFDGYVIGGSPASANGGEAWINTLMSFIRELDAEAIPTIGVCFGHQVIARALGGRIDKNPGGWGFGVSPTAFIKHEAWMFPPKEKLNLYAAHSEQVLELPRHAEMVGGSTFCPFGSYKIGNHIFTTEYHPEMTPEFFVDLTHELEKYIGMPVAQEARKQCEVPSDGNIFAQWMVQFFEMPR